MRYGGGRQVRRKEGNGQNISRARTRSREVHRKKPSAATLFWLWEGDVEKRVPNPFARSAFEEQSAIRHYSQSTRVLAVTCSFTYSTADLGSRESPVISLLIQSWHRTGDWRNISLEMSGYGSRRRIPVSQPDHILWFTPHMSQGFSKSKSHETFGLGCLVHLP